MQLSLRATLLLTYFIELRSLLSRIQKRTDRKLFIKIWEILEHWNLCLDYRCCSVVYSSFSPLIGEVLMELSVLLVE